MISIEKLKKFEENYKKTHKLSFLGGNVLKDFIKFIEKEQKTGRKVITFEQREIYKRRRAIEERQKQEGRFDPEKEFESLAE